MVRIEGCDGDSDVGKSPRIDCIGALQATWLCSGWIHHQYPDGLELVESLLEAGAALHIEATCELGTSRRPIRGQRCQYRHAQAGAEGVCYATETLGESGRVPGGHIAIVAKRVAAYSFGWRHHPKGDQLMTMDVRLMGWIVDGPHEAETDGDPNPRPHSYFRYGDRGALFYNGHSVDVPVMDCLDVVLYGEDSAERLAGLRTGDQVLVEGVLEARRRGVDDDQPALIAVIATKVERR